jgi:hypothetical protein
VNFCINAEKLLEGELKFANNKKINEKNHGCERVSLVLRVESKNSGVPFFHTNIVKRKKNI